MQKAFDYLLEICDRDPPDGTVEIDGTNVYAIVQSYDSDPATDVLKFEAHRRYIDIQYLVSGKEIMGWAHLGKMMTTIPYEETKDAQYGVVKPDETTLIHYEAGHAVVLFSTDAHSPGLADGVSEAVKKIVVKIAVTAD
jgi:YhcH/YjgK/YiaL family protein